MKNFLTLFILTISGFTLHAQGIVTGTVKDINTNENIDLVTISTGDLQYNTISNAEGNFKLEYPAGTEKIVLNYLGYAPLEVSLTDLPADNMFYLESKGLELEEVVIMNTPMDEFIKNLVKTSYNKLNAPFLLSTYYREFVKINDRYTKFSDGLIDYNVLKKKKEVESEVVVKQSRAIKLDIEDEEEIDVASPLDLRKAVSRDCNFGALSVIMESFKDYSFIVKSQGKEGQKLQTIYFEPLPDVEKPLFAGTITYNPDNNLILNVDVHMAETHKKYSKLRNFILIKARLDDIYYRSIYSLNGDSYRLSYSCLGGDVYVKNKKRFDDHIIFKSDLIVTNFSSNLAAFTRKEKYKEKALYTRGTNYSEEFWKKNNSIQLTAQEEQIIKSLQDSK